MAAEVVSGVACLVAACDDQDVDPHAAPALCALGVALAAFLVVPRSVAPPIAPVRAEPVAPAPVGPRPVLRTFRLRDRDPVTAVFEDGTYLHHIAGETHVGPLSPPLLEKLAALRARNASFSSPAQHTGCLANGGMELVGHGERDGWEPPSESLRVMRAIWREHDRRRALDRSPLVVAATLVSRRPPNVVLRIEAILKVDDDMPAPTPGSTLAIPSSLVDVPHGSSWKDVPASGVWTVALRPDGAEWWPEPKTDVEEARRDLAWLAAQPPPAVREALLRRALEGAPDPVISPQVLRKQAAFREEAGFTEPPPAPPPPAP